MAEEQLPKVTENKKDIVEAARELPSPEGGFSLRPRNFDEAYRFANLIASSDLVPKDFRDKPANVLVAVQLGMELGISPIQALQNIAVINGRPTIWGDLLPALIFSSGLLESIDEQGDEKGARCTVKRRGFAPVTREFTWEDAKRAKTVEYGKTISLAEKGTYQSYPKRMLQMRARAFALRDMFADVLKGLAIREEVEDFADAENATDVTPPKPAIQAPQPTKEKPGEQPRELKADAPSDIGDSHVDSHVDGNAEQSTSKSEPDRGDAKLVESAEGADKPKEKTVLEIALEEIAGYTTDTLPVASALNVYMKGQPRNVQAEICAAYDKRKAELGL